MKVDCWFLNCILTYYVNEHLLRLLWALACEIFILFYLFTLPTCITSVLSVLFQVIDIFIIWRNLFILNKNILLNGSITLVRKMRNMYLQLNNCFILISVVISNTRWKLVRFIPSQTINAKLRNSLHPELMSYLWNKFVLRYHGVLGCRLFSRITSGYQMT